MKSILAWLIVVTVSLLAACGGKAQIASPGGEWQLATLNGVPTLADYPVMMNVEGNQVNGHAGCNIYSGEITIESNTFGFGPIMRTEMACNDQAAMTQENEFFATLIEVRGYHIDEAGMLAMTDSTGVVMLEFRPADGTVSNQPPAEPVSTTVAIDNNEPTPVPVVLPPAGFNAYRDSITGVEVYIPESWIVTGVIEGEVAILQSYPQDKYIGGEAREPGDTKCDLTIRPTEIDSVLAGSHRIETGLNRGKQVSMFFHVVTFFWGFVLDLTILSGMTDDEKDLQILLLRQQLRIVERKKTTRLIMPRWQKVPLARNHKASSAHIINPVCGFT